jgi:hypothetical protein
MELADCLGNYGELVFRESHPALPPPTSKQSHVSRDLINYNTFFGLYLQDFRMFQGLNMLSDENVVLDTRTQ